MNESIFRKKSLDRISSPEEIDDYMRVTSPGIWIVLGAIILLLAGAVIWSITGRIQTTIEESGQVSNGQVTAQIAKEDLGGLTVGSKVCSGKLMGEVTAVTGGDGGYEVVASVPGLEDGMVTVTFVTESVAPITFLTK